MKKNRQTDESNTRDIRDLGRRDFLANAALVGAGLAIGPSVWPHLRISRKPGATRGSAGDGRIFWQQRREELLNAVRAEMELR